MKNYLWALLLVLTGTICSAQDSTNENEAIVPLNNKLGFAGSMLSGYGLSYAYNISKVYTVEFTGSIYGEGGSKDVNTYSNPFIVATVGMEFQRNFYANPNFRFYGLAGLSFWLDNTTYYYENTSGDIYDNEHSYVGGLALGWELTIAKRFVINLEGGYLYRSTSNVGRENDYSSGQKVLRNYSRSTYSIGFGVGGGIYYAF